MYYQITSFAMLTKKTTENIDNSTFKSVQHIHTKKLDSRTIQRIYDIEQDMWARWIWEFVQCQDCWNIDSKDDIFWNITNPLIKKQTVSQILRILWKPEINCSDCWWQTNMIYGSEYIDAITRRYSNFISFLSTFHVWHQIEWFTDWYYSNFDVIYQEELKWHYGDIPQKEISNKIDSILWRKSPGFLTVCSTGFTEPYSNLTNFFYLLRSFFQSIPNFYNHVPGIIEVDENNHICDIYQRLWAKKVELWNAFREKYTHDNHHCSVFVIDNPVKLFKQENTSSIKKILKNF